MITDEEFRFALISVHELADSPHGNMIMEDIGWLDVRRVHGDQIMISDKPPPMGSGLNHKDNLLEFGSTFGTRSDRSVHHFQSLGASTKCIDDSSG